MMLLRSRHEELDFFRTIDRGFNTAWHMFFGTLPLGLHPTAVVFTKAERDDLTAEVQTLTDADVGHKVAPYIIDRKKCDNTVDGMHASLPKEEL